MDISVLQLSFGILESSPSISLEEVFYLGKGVEVSSDLFLILVVPFIVPGSLSFLNFRSKHYIATDGVAL